MDYRALAAQYCLPRDKSVPLDANTGKACSITAILNAALALSTGHGQDAGMPLTDLEAEKQRADQLGRNCAWLLEMFDRIRARLPGPVLTWQARVMQCVEGVDRLVAERNRLEAFLAEILDEDAKDHGGEIWYAEYVSQVIREVRRKLKQPS